MSITKIPSLRRQAIYEAYSNKCFYCGKPIRWDDFEIDHLIAEKTENIEEVLKEYELSEDYDLNGLSNLVPVHSVCNNQKSNTPLEKSTYLFYRMRVDKHIDIIKKIEFNLKKECNKGKLLSKIDIAVEEKQITLLSLHEHITQLLEEKWKNKIIHLSTPIEFVGLKINELPILSDYSNLLDIHLDINSEDWGITLGCDENDDHIEIHTLNEWRKFTSEGFYPITTCDIKLSGYFDYLDTLLVVLSKIIRSKYSSIEEFKFSDISQLSSSILIDPDDTLKKYGDCSIGWLIDNKLAKIEIYSKNEIKIEYEGFEHYYSEQFRGDANCDELEEIFVICSYQAIGGSLGWCQTELFGRISKNELVRIVENPWDSSEIDYRSTLR